MLETALSTTRLALALGLLAAAAGCAAQAERPPDPPDPFVTGVGDIADSLVAAAERRTDLSSMRLYIHALDEDRMQNPYGRALASHELAAVNQKLEQELVAALGNRMNLLDVELDQGALARSTGKMNEVAEAYGATHALVGSYVRQGAQLLLSVRIVEARSLLIVAAARGAVPCDLLGPLSRTADAAGETSTTAVPLALGPAPTSVVSPSTARLGREVTILPEEGAEIAPPEEPVETPVESPLPAVAEEQQVAAAAVEGVPPGEASKAAPVETPQTTAPPATEPAGLAQADPALPPEFAGLEDLPRVDGPAAQRLRARQERAKEKD